MSNYDQLHRYLFDDHAVRGELVTLSDTFQQILNNHLYPQPVQMLLGEMLVATCLLTATLKLSGDITIQLQGDGPLSLLVINGNHRQEMRGVARIHGTIAEQSTLKQMIGQGHLVITITPVTGERYQSIVALEGETLTDILQNYFQQSEQLPTRLFLHHDNINNKPIVGGLLLQVLPMGPSTEDSLNHLAQLTATLTATELFNLPVDQVLHRLYHQQRVTLFGAQPIIFRCTCSRIRTQQALLTLPSTELNEILTKNGYIETQCDYCSTHYRFHRQDLEPHLDRIH